MDLLGYRFSDGFTLLGSVAVTQPMIIQPHESVVFVKNPTVGSFIDWWGAEQLPRGLQLISYSGFSLSSQGDALYLWAPFAEDPNEFVDSISYASNLEGVSQRFDYDTAPLGSDSVEGEYGAFRAQPCGDVGSPGYTANAAPRFVGITREADGAHLKWRAVQGKTYQMEYNAEPRASGWSVLGRITAPNSLPTMIDPGARNISRRFYRVVEVNP